MGTDDQQSLVNGALGMLLDAEEAKGLQPCWCQRVSSPRGIIFTAASSQHSPCAAIRRAHSLSALIQEMPF